MGQTVTLVALVALLVRFHYQAAVAAETNHDDISLLQVGRGTKMRSPRAGTYYRQELDNFDDLQYTGNISLDGQVLQSVLDTGSYEIVAFSTLCGERCGLAGLNGYSAKQSSTYEAGQLAKTHVYGSGSVLSYDGVEQLRVGPLTVDKQDFWEAVDAMMPILQHATFQAIVGLGPPGEPKQVAREMYSEAQELLSRYQERGMTPPPAVQHLADQDMKIAELVLAKHDNLPQNLGVRYFSACFEWSLNGKGYLIWNDVAPSAQSVQFTPINVVGNISWSVGITGARFEGPEGIIDLGCHDGCEAVVDTGTSLIAVPTAIYNMAANELAKLDANCSNMQQMPNLVIMLSGQEYSLPPQTYIGVVRGRGNSPLESSSSSSPIRACELLLIDMGYMGGAHPMWILGMPWFRYYYTTFDLGSDPTNPNGRKIWTAPADENCYPARPAQHLSKIYWARAQPLWRINGPNIRMPRWHRKPDAAPWTSGERTARSRPSFRLGSQDTGLPA